MSPSLQPRVAFAMLGAGAAIATLAIGLQQGSASMTTLSSLIMLGVCVLALWSDRVRAYPVLAFIVCYAVFLMGRQAVNLALGTPAGQDGVLGTGASSEASMVHANVALFVGLAGLLAGWVLSRGGAGPSGSQQSSDWAPRVRRTAGWLMALSLPFAVLAIWRAASAVADTGFYDARISAAMSMPFPVRVGDALFHVSFFAYLAARPTRRGALRASVIYMLVATLSLATLARYEFLLSAAVVLMYLYHRQIRWGESWFTRRRVLLGVLAAPGVLWFLNAIGSQRGRGPLASEGLFAPILDFARAQGVSIKVIVFSDELSATLPAERFYSVGPLIEFSQRIWAMIVGAPSPVLSGQNAQRAVEGHQLAHTISYLISPTDYLRGTGYGSSYVAELMVDFGLVGVFVGSLLYGWLLTRATRGLYASIPITFLTLLLLKGAMFVPRASTVQPLVEPFATPSLLAMALLVAMIKLSPRHRDRAATTRSHPTRRPAHVRRAPDVQSQD